MGEKESLVYRDYQKSMKPAASASFMEFQKTHISPKFCKEIQVNSREGISMKIAFYDAKPYDRVWFDKYVIEYGYTIKYIESHLSLETTILAKGCEAVCVFVNDIVDK